MKEKLDSNKKNLLRKASRIKIEGNFASFPSRYRCRKWLPKDNYYRRLCTEHYAKDLNNRPPSVNSADLISYVSASAPTHVIDGWSYLGRAIDATLRGDAYAATHLGYYAELRAAMGLLASEGIGIFKNKHPIIDERGATHTLKGKGTHSDIWPILKYWVTLSRASDLLDNLVMPNSIHLSDWLNVTTSGISQRAVAQQWLRSWGLDLEDIDNDHNCRNYASYRPSEFRKPQVLNGHEQALFVEDLWRLFEPSATRRFLNLERYLLKNAHRQSSTSSTVTIIALQNLGLSLSESTEWLNFFSNANEPIPLKYAEDRAPVEDPTCHLRIISRAALLLFVASASARSLLTKAGYSSNDILFWWGQYGKERALWRDDDVPEDPQDLWADIAQSINESAEWRDNNPSQSCSLLEWRRHCNSTNIDFGSFELVGMWALIP